MRECIILTDSSLITCVVQKGFGDEVVRAAYEAGAQGATISYGHGSGIREKLGILGLAIEVEKEIVMIIAANDQVDSVFEKIFLACHLDTPGRGIMYVSPIEKMTTYVPQEMIQQLRENNAPTGAPR